LADDFFGELEGDDGGETPMVGVLLPLNLLSLVGDEGLEGGLDLLKRDGNMTAEDFLPLRDVLCRAAEVWCKVTEMVSYHSVPRNFLFMISVGWATRTGGLRGMNGGLSFSKLP
jgi:hypothetical protein